MIEHDKNPKLIEQFKVCGHAISMGALRCKATVHMIPLDCSIPLLDPCIRHCHHLRHCDHQATSQIAWATAGYVLALILMVD